MKKSELSTKGLTSGEVERSRAAHGANIFSAKKGKGFWRRYLESLGDPVIRVLLLALLLHLLLLLRSGDIMETVGIAVSILLATLISTLSEQKSEAAFRRLQESCGGEPCRVRRETVREIDATELVVGDVVLLSAGERIPADGVLLSGGMTVDEAPLSGESREVEKRPFREGDAQRPGEPSALFAGCTLRSGEGELYVTQVGDSTYLGGISGELQQQKRESPLRARLSHLAGQISRIGYLMAAICALAMLFNTFVIDVGFDFSRTVMLLNDVHFLAGALLRALMLGLTVVVVAVPEGLPMMIAVVLSANMRRMVRDRVLVRKPEGIEAAGSMNILFTDKTGTLTAGALSLCGVLTAKRDFASMRAVRRAAPALHGMLCLAAHANSGAVRGEAKGRAAALGGNATDRALLSVFLQENAPVYGVLRRLPFDSSRKYAAVELSDGKILVTGAPERLLPGVRDAYDENGALVPFSKVAFSTRLRARAAAGERVLLLCEATKMPGERIEGPLTLLAAVAFSDPLRPEAKKTVRGLQEAGVQVVMLTGDSRDTAVSLATASGILYGERVALSGEELAALSDKEVSALLPRLAVVARALPRDKSRLVRLSAAAGLVVGMTGDGINDAPALQQADVGFAMGSGMQVAKEAGDIVILDDNLASVARAVLYGRTVFKSIRKFITLQLMMNFCAVGISIIGPFIGVDAPVTVVQMLWINLIMDTLGGLAFAGEAPLPFYMKERPKRRDEPILTRGIAARIAVLSAFTVGLSVFFLKSPLVRGFYRESEGDVCLLTGFFALFIFASVCNCFNARSDRVRMLSGLAQNRSFLLIMALVAAVQVAFVYLGGSVLRTVPLLPRELLFTLLLALTVLPVGWLQLIWRRLAAKERLY